MHWACKEGNIATGVLFSSRIFLKSTRSKLPCKRKYLFLYVSINSHFLSKSSTDILKACIYCMNFVFVSTKVPYGLARPPGGVVKNLYFVLAEVRRPLN